MCCLRFADVTNKMMATEMRRRKKMKTHLKIHFILWSSRNVIVYILMTIILMLLLFLAHSYIYFDMHDMFDIMYVFFNFF